MSEVERVETTGLEIADFDHDGIDDFTNRPFSVTSLAEHWGVSTGTIYAMIKRGDLRATRLGGKLYRIATAEVEQIENAEPVLGRDDD